MLLHTADPAAARRITGTATNKARHGSRRRRGRLRARLATNEGLNSSQGPWHGHAWAWVGPSVHAIE